MLQPVSNLSGGVTQCFLLNSASHAVASGIGSAAGMKSAPHFRCRSKRADVELPLGKASGTAGFMVVAGVLVKD